MSSFEQAFTALNNEQQAAVNSIDGPLLIVAGPGTGKTQLLSLRVANILRRTDTPAQSVLCLTFTESGAANMRDRLSRFIGKQAYDVGIYTYHAFAGELIRRFPQYFEELRAEEPIDEIGAYQLVRDIVAQLPYDNPLKQSQYHLQDLISTISDVKRSMLTSEDLRTIFKNNKQAIKQINPELKRIFADFGLMPRKLDDARVKFDELHMMLKTLSAHHEKLSIVTQLRESLDAALEQAAESQKTTPLTQWKNQWLAKNADNVFVLSFALANQRLSALADVLDAYQSALAKKGLYDFNDMILHVVTALKSNDELRYTLQEQYLYFLLDEFQDTNAAQLELVLQLTNNPVMEGRPNIMAVGDDDQAIYSFQGAHISNIIGYRDTFIATKLIHLQSNYRSHGDILDVAHNIATQITSRLTLLEGTNKQKLHAKAHTSLQQAHIERREFVSDIGQYDGVARSIQKLIDDGVAPDEIAILAPKHKYLEPFMPYLRQLEIPVNYEKREDILQTPIIRQLTTMVRLVQSLATSDYARADSLWPEVLSYDFWSVPIPDIWETAWQAKSSKKSWAETALQHKTLKPTVQLITAIASKAYTANLEQVLDYIIGNEPIDLGQGQKQQLTSPMRAHYTDKAARAPELFYETIFHLTVLRQKLREHQRTTTTPLSTQDYLAFVDLYEQAGQRLLNTSPYTQQTQSVQVMTVFKAKGLEFSYVFVVSCQDEVWGDSSRQQTNRLTLPPNLAYIRPAGATSDERLRIFYVALTRAKKGLFLTSFQRYFNGKTTKRLKYLDERQNDDGTIDSHVLPEPVRRVLLSTDEQPSIVALQNNWAGRHIESLQSTKIQDLLKERLQNYQLSPTHFLQFLDLEFAGPNAFLLHTLLRFPRAMSLEASYGSAMHATLEWLQQQVSKQDHHPSMGALEQFLSAQLLRARIPKSDQILLKKRGLLALESFLLQHPNFFSSDDYAEYDFRDESVFLDNVHLAGKIDLLRVDAAQRTIEIVDYKTGKAHTKWASDTRLHRYKQQLYFYKLLVENSRTFKGYRVTGGRLLFIDPDAEQKTVDLCLEFNEKETKRLQKLILAVWNKIQTIYLPDISAYPISLKGIQAFEDDLLGS